jgi:hypothetical protein
MARPAGTPLVRERVKLFVPEEWVIKSGKRRYIFVNAVQPKIFTLSNSVYNSNKLSARFSQLLHRNMYATKTFYGLRAIDIDTPQKGAAVSVELEIIVGEGKDTSDNMSQGS